MGVSHFCRLKAVFFPHVYTLELNEEEGQAKDSSYTGNTHLSLCEDSSSLFHQASPSSQFVYNVNTGRLLRLNGEGHRQTKDREVQTQATDCLGDQLQNNRAPKSYSRREPKKVGFGQA